MSTTHPIAYQRTHIHSSADVRAIADHAGSFFFSAGAMDFFSSRLLAGVYPLDGAEARPGSRFLFITSERHGDAGSTPRHYAVRQMTLGVQRDNRPAVDVVTVGDYHATAAEARKAAAAIQNDAKAAAK